MIQTIIFDFGNVVGFFDHRLVSSRLLPHAAVAAEEIHRLIFGGALEDEYEKGRLTSAEFLRQVRDRCGLGCPDDVVVQSYVDIFWPNPDVCGILPRLKPAYRLMLASNTTELHFRQFREQFAEPLRFFDDVVVSFAIGARKPSPAFFEHCLRRAGCAASACVFIDDLPANVEGARACGLHGIVYAGPDALRRELAALGVRINA
jgi:putative hydrolase of the HAD superfamily